MDDGWAAEVAGEQVSSRRVLLELEALRAGSGITPRKIPTHAPGILKLPLVFDQLELKSLSKEDLHIAAYSAIGCVIEHAIPGVLEQRLLIWTLRYDYSLLAVGADQDWERIRAGATLADRHKMIQQLLYLGRSTYFAHVAAAYEELADQLVLRDRSPCRGSAEVNYARSLARASLREMLLLFSSEGRRQIREIIAELVLDDVGMISPDESTATHRLESLIRSSLFGGGYSRIHISMANQMRAPKDRILTPWSMQYLIFPNKNRGFLDRLARIGENASVSAEQASAQAALSFHLLADSLRDFRQIRAHEFQ